MFPLFDILHFKMNLKEKKISILWQVNPSVAAGIADTGDKFATGADDTGGAPWLANISVNFQIFLNNPDD